MQTTTQIIAKNVRSLMEREGMVQIQLAERAGVSQRTISNVVRGAHQPRIEVLDALAKALGVSVSDLCTLKGRAA